MELTLMVIFLLGRLLLGGYFLMMGVSHFMKLDMLSGYAASKNVPMPKAAVTVSGLLLLFGGYGILTGFYVQWALVALALFLLPVTLMMHAFWKESDPMKRMPEQVNFMKNTALLGSVLMFIYIFWQR